MANMVEFGLTGNFTALMRDLGVLEARVKKLTQPGKINLRIEHADKTIQLLTQLNNIKMSKTTIKNLNDFGTALEKIAKIKPSGDLNNFLTQLSNIAKELKNIRDIQNQGGGGNNNNLSGNLGRLFLGQEVITIAQQQIKTLAEFDNAIYNLGVVAEFPLEKIESFKKAMLDLGASVPVATNEIIKALDTVVKTGATITDAQEIINAGIKLAVASGGYRPKILLCWKLLRAA